MKRLGYLVTGVVIAALVFLVAADASGNSLFPWRQSEQRHSAILKSIQDISQYHAAVGTFEKVIDDKDNLLDGLDWIPGIENAINSWPGAAFERRTLYIAEGTVDAYVDLSGLTDGDVQLSEDGTTVTIWLPAAELSEPNLNEERSGLYDEKRGVVVRIVDAIETHDQTKVADLAVAEIAQAADESDLKERAEENTRAMLVGMFDSVGIAVQFTDEATTEASE